MTLAHLVLLALKCSIIGTVFALGLRTPFRDLTLLLRHPGQLVRSVLAMNFIMPLVAATLVLLFRPGLPLAVMIIAVSLAPVPPMLPKKLAKASGDQTYGSSLLVVAALLAIVSIPISVELIQRVFQIPLSISPSEVFKLLLTSLLAPLAVGLVLHQLAPKTAVRVAGPLASIAGIVLILAALVIIVSSWRAIVGQLGGATLLVIAIFLVVGLAAGHLLGGPGPTDRTVLALATASRHPGVAIGIAHIAAPDAKGLLPILLLYLVAGAILSLPYVAWRKKANAMPELDG